MADPDAAQRAADLWLAQAKRYPEDANVRRSAATAIGYCFPERDEQMLSTAHDQAGLGSLYASAVLGVTGISYSSTDAAGSDAALRATPFAARARKILEGATDKDLLVAAAGTLLNIGGELWADGKLDWDYTPLGARLLDKAKAASPDSLRLFALSSVLPARGERPPAVLRVGGNVQQNKLIRRVMPRYPPEAKMAGIRGIVSMAALIGLDGSIIRLSVLSGPPELVSASVEAVYQWRYKPTMLNGKPCYIITQIDVNYVLNR